MRRMLLWLTLIAAVSLIPLRAEAITTPQLDIWSTTPYDGEWGVSLHPTIIAVFNMELDPQTVDGSKVTLEGSVSGPITGHSIDLIGTPEQTTQIEIFEPEEGYIDGETITVTLDGSLASVDGYLLSEMYPDGYSWSFTIGGSTSTTFEVTEAYPEDGGTSYHDTMIGVMFNKVVDATTINAENVLIFGNMSGPLQGRTTFHVLTETYDTGETIIEVPPGTSVVLMEIDYTQGFLAIGEMVRVSLSPAIMSTENDYLSDFYGGPYKWTWTVIDGSGGLQVSWVFPEDGAWDIDPMNPIVVQFDRPLDFGSLDRTEVSIVGSINGPYTVGISNDNGNDTRLVAWVMDQQYQLGETVTVTLSGSIMGYDGTSLGSDYSWSFNVINELPPFEVVYVQPWPGSENVPVDAEILIEFSRPLHYDTLVEMANQWFIIQSNEVGSLNYWYETPSPNSIVIHPDAPFIAADQITIIVSTDVLAADGVTTLVDDWPSSFTVDPNPNAFYVTDTFPDEFTGVMEIAPERDIEVWFNKGANPATLISDNIQVFNFTRWQSVAANIQIDEWNLASMRIVHEPFGLGDSIGVTLTSGILSQDATALTPHEFGFRVRAVDPIRVQVGSASAPMGGSVVIPVMVQNDLTPHDVSSFQFQIGFNASEIALTGWSVEGTLGQEYWGLEEITVGNQEPGIYTFAGASESTGPYLQGTGVLVYLTFSHTGENSTWNDIWIDYVDGYVFNEDDIWTELHHGSVSFEQVGVVHGHVFYSTTEAPVSNVNVTLSNWDAQIAATTTDASGYYEFTDVPDGDYWLQFHVLNTSGRADAITAMDASEILKHVTRITQLQGMPWLAGDVTWNGTVTAYDASHVLSFAVNSEYMFPAPMWLFPYHFDQFGFDDRVWIDVYGGEVIQNMEVILAGDATGNWGIQAPAKPAGAARVVSVATAAEAWRVDVGEGTPVSAAIIELTADQSLNIAGVDVAEGWISEYRVNGETVRIALAGADDISDPFQLISIRHTGSAPSIVDAQVTLNDGMVGARVVTTAPAQFALHYPAPNPFNPATEILFELPSSGPIELVVTNAIGQHVRTLVSGVGTQGAHRVTWNGLDDAGRAVASGSYVITLRFNVGTEAQSILHRRALLVR